jgi:tetratricopeptide (TPR) repeat protein
MPDIFEYIESYFQQTLSNEERFMFETRCETDKSFAKEVAFYITTRNSLREELLRQKQKEWKDENAEQEETARVISMRKKPTSFGRLITYAAAACLLLAASVYLFEAQTSTHNIAFNYVKTNYGSLSQTMDASRDSIQLGIANYNNKEYDKALQLFEGVESRDPSNSDAKKYAGLAYLQKQDYDKALQQFDKLANMQGLFSNPGDLLKAATLLERNEPGDKEEAQKLLQKVVNEKEEGSEEAEEWLKKM